MHSQHSEKKIIEDKKQSTVMNIQPFAKNLGIEEEIEEAIKFFWRCR